MDTFLSICVGVGLATACGLRVFIPLLITSIAAHFFKLPLSSGFHWMSSTPALMAFSVASALEIGGYYVPWIDHALDTIATPSAMIAGTIISVALMSNVDPFYKWALALIAGGGMAGIVQGTTVVARGASTATTGGLGNPLFSMELAGSIVVSILAIVVPVLVVLLIVTIFSLIGWWLLRRKPRTTAISA
jgi:hypothetical protein